MERDRKRAEVRSGEVLGNDREPDLNPGRLLIRHFYEFNSYLLRLAFMGFWAGLIDVD